MHLPLALLLLLAPTLAPGPQAVTAEAELALAGLDPVELCAGVERPGRDDLVAIRPPYRYRFASEANRSRFESEPERFAIQWGGGCGGMGPLSGRGDPDRWAVHDGRIWIFASDGCRAGFLAEPERYAAAPEPPPAPRDPEAVARGRAWMEKAVRAHGGAEALDAARALRLANEGASESWRSEGELVVAADGRVAERSSWFVSGSEACTFETWWILSAAGARKLEDGVPLEVSSPAQIADVRRTAQREPLSFLWARERLVPVDLGPGRLGETEVERVQVELDGLVTTLLLAPADGRVLGLTWRGRLDEGITREIVETFNGWIEIGEVRLPVARSTTADGEQRTGLAWSSAELLAEIPADVF